MKRVSGHDHCCVCGKDRSGYYVGPWRDFYCHAHEKEMEEAERVALEREDVGADVDAEPSAVQWMVPTQETPFGEILKIPLEGPVMLLYRGSSHGWRAADGWAAHTHLAHQLYTRHIAPLTQHPAREIVAVAITKGRWITLWASSPSEVTQLAERVALAPEVSDEPLTEDWLREVGFKWHQLDRQPHRHWLLWLDVGEGPALDVGLELAPGALDGEWFCWLRSDLAGRYSRFIHVRHVKTRGDVAQLVEAITGRPWNPVDHLYGRAMRPEQAARERAANERLDRKWMTEGNAWREVEKDDTMGGALPEHLEAHHQAQPQRGIDA